MSSAGSDKLVEIERSEWKKLRDMYLSDWPKNIVGYSTLDNFIRWIDIEPEIKYLKVYCLNGDWSDGTFVIVDRYQLFLNSLDQSNDRLRTALSLLDWSHGLKISTYLERHLKPVLEVVASKDLKLEWGNSLTPVFYFPKSEASKVEVNCPDDIVLKPLSSDDAVIANEVWPNRHIGSEFFLKRIAKWNPNIGAFKKDSNELVAWCFQLQAGPLGALQVKDNHMRKGYGALVLRAMIKIMAAKDKDTFACVGEDNIASKNMFEKTGFKLIDNAYWLRTSPTVQFTWVDD